ncbi:MAG: energy transducer TonB [Cyanobacteria bacterium J06633_8]
MISFIQRLATTLLIFSSLSNIASAQMTDEAEVQSIPNKSQAENFPVEKLSSLPDKPKSKPKKSRSKCISNCSLPNATSYIKNNFDGIERTVRIAVTYDKKGKVTDVQINPSTGNSEYDRVIREDAFKLRFSPAKSGTLTYRFRIVEQPSGIFSNASSYIRSNFDGIERTVRIAVTYNKNGKVTDVQINPSTGNSDYDSVIRENAFKLRFSPGKSGSLTFGFNIVKPGSQKQREAEKRRRENERRRREAEERRRREEEAKKQKETENQPQTQPTRKPITPIPVTPPKPVTPPPESNSPAE